MLFMLAGRVNDAESLASAKKALELKGHDAISPTDIDYRCSEVRMTNTILRLLDECEGVAVLQGWESDKTACMTVAVARACGIDVMTIEETTE